jgi:lipopolysaccharide/colanic/teichoic acid biosynthesis glycosyltransferase
MTIRKFMVRQFVKPGITGWAQIHGYRGEIIVPEDMQARVDHDIWYMENWNTLLDFKIVFFTVYNMLKGEKNAF